MLKSVPRRRGGEVEGLSVRGEIEGMGVGWRLRVMIGYGGDV
ncbi:hypothetical protein [Bartonella schoenbuchensis]|nr:hypothetical protein [Bartonella schoenbuchensis]